MRKRDRNTEGKQVGIVINGSTLVWAMEKETQKDFFKLGFLSDSCICCRVSPAQKAEVVKLAKTHGSWVTLSIGDGANDVSMIQEAHIGVGIAGKEGAQAVQAADFSFSQFRFLQRLLLVHGRWNYRRVSWFICYYFYKNVTVVFTELWFAFFNGFSGQIYFADWLPQLYNSFWTSWPCMFTFVYERDLSPEASLQYPIAYSAGQRGLYFTFKRFWLWISLAICHGLICFWVPTQGISNVEKDAGLWLTSTLSFTLIIHVVTYKLFLESIYWTKVNMCVTYRAAGITSVLFYYLTVIVLNSHNIAITFQPQMNQVFYELLSNGQAWIVIIVTPFLCLLPDFFIAVCRTRFWQTPVDAILKVEKERKKGESEGT